MEDLWRVKKAGVDMKDFADHAEYRRFLQRYSDDEEQNHRQRLLYGDSKIEKTSGQKRNLNHD